jgi:fructokinase
MNRTERPIENPVVVGIGEALFDCFEDRSQLGGAPVNFTVHIHNLLGPIAGRGTLVSRVGDDRLGRELIADLESRGLPTSFLQIDRQHPTGQVLVELTEHGQPSYTIAENAAWDFLAFEESLQSLAASCDAICFGTLAQRSMTSRATIDRFLNAATGAIRLCDVNLRQRFFTDEVLRTSFEVATIAKVNEEELTVVSERLGGPRRAPANTDERARRLLEQFGWELLVLTRGSEGTVLYTPQEKLVGDPVRVRQAPHADSVGAGDACCAGILFGLLRQWPLHRLLALANQLGAFVASQPGATPRLPDELLEFAHGQSA